MLFRESLITGCLVLTLCIMSLCLAKSQSLTHQPIVPAILDTVEVKPDPAINPRYRQVNELMQRTVQLYGSSEDYQHSIDLFYKLNGIEWYFLIQDGDRHGQPQPTDVFYLNGNVDSSNRNNYTAREYENDTFVRLLVVEHKRPESVQDYPHQLIWGAQYEKMNKQGQWEARGAFLYRYSDGRFMYGTMGNGKRNERWFTVED